MEYSISIFEEAAEMANVVLDRIVSERVHGTPLVMKAEGYIPGDRTKHRWNGAGLCFNMTTKLRVPKYDLPFRTVQEERTRKEFAHVCGC